MLITEFKDKYVIRRMTGEKDEFENEVSVVVDEGYCNYQKGGQTAYSIATRDDVVYIPHNDILFYENDVVEVVTQSGRKESGVVKIPRDIRLSQTGVRVTKLELKQATGQ